MKGRFLYVGAFQLPDKNAAAQRVLGIAKALRALEYDVVFLDVNDECSSFDVGNPHDTKGFETYSRPYPVGLRQWMHHALHPVNVQEILEKYNDWKGVIAYNYPGIALDRLISLCHRLNIKVFADCTEWYPFDFHDLHRVFVSIDSFLRMRWAQKKVDGVIAISSFLANYYRPHANVVIIPPLVDVEEEKWQGVNEIQTSNGRIKFYYVGSPGHFWRKDLLGGIVRVLDGIQDVDALEFNVVGITCQQFMEEFPEEREMAEHLVDRQVVKFHGRLPHNQALAMLKSADYSIFLREKNRITTAGFPTKFVESVTCGVPVITTDTSDLKEYAADSKNAFILPCDSFDSKLADLLEAIARKQVTPLIVEKALFDYHGYFKKLEAFLKV